MKKKDIYIEDEQDYVRQKEQRDLTFNGMSATEWALNSRSVWKDLPSPKSDSKMKDVEIVPVELADRIVNMYSREGDILLDPFMGSGTTVISSIHNNRFCYGYEIDEKRFKTAEDNILNSLNLLVGGGYSIANEDCFKGLNHLQDDLVQLTITSPSLPKLRKGSDESLNFEEVTYDRYMELMEAFMENLYRVTKKNGYAVFVVSDYRNIKGNQPYVEFHADIARAAVNAGFLYQDLIIYDHNDQRGLLLLGYPSIFYANLNHSYVVVMRK